MKKGNSNTKAGINITTIAIEEAEPVDQKQVVTIEDVLKTLREQGVEI